MKPFLRRVRRAGRAAAWAAAHPSEARKYGPWLRQQLVPRPKPGPMDGGILFLGPSFLKVEGVPIVDPTPMAAEDAEHMRDDDLVLGIEVGGEARAYPWWVMDNHHAANDVVAGVPIALMFCEVCGTGIHVDPVVEGQRLLFAVRGIYNGTNFFEDSATGTLWSPYLSMGIEGPLRGQRLELRPVSQMTWVRWRALFPATTVLPPALGDRSGHGSEDTMTSTNIPSMFRRTLSRSDARLPEDEIVLGILAESWEGAVPLASLRSAGGILNLQGGATPLVALCDDHPGSYGASAFDRRLDGRALEFERADEGTVDRETRSVWDLGGKAIAGPLHGSQLRYVPSHVSKWFIWAAHFPEIEIVQAPQGAAD